MKHINLKSIFCILLLLPGVSQASWGANATYTFPSGFTLYYDFTAISWGGVNYWNNGTDLAYTTDRTTIHSYTFTNNITVYDDWYMVKTEINGWDDVILRFDKAPSNGQNCIKVAADGKSYTWTTYGSSSCNISEAPSGVIAGTHVMFYIESYNGNNVTIGTSKKNVTAAKTTNVTDGKSYILIEKGQLSTNYYITNNPSNWEGVPNNDIKTAKGGEYFVGNSSISKTDAKTATTTTSLNSNTLSISTTANSATGVYNNLQLYILYYIDGTFASVTHNGEEASYCSIKASTSALSSTYNVSSLSAGEHTLLTVLSDGNIYYIADSDKFTIGSVTTTYTVTFNANGHGTAPASQSVESGKTATKPADPTATGYTFGGWYTEAGCTNAYNFSTTVTKNITLYAKWTQDPTATKIYVQGRFKVRTSEGGTTWKYTGTNDGDWNTGSTNIAFTYDAVSGYYKLNTYCSVAELSEPKNDGYFFHFKEGNTEYGAFTDNVLPTTDIPASANIKQETKNYRFTDACTAGDNVVLYIDWTNKKFWYSTDAPTLTYWYFDKENTGWDGTIADKWKMTQTAEYAYVAVPAYSGTDNKFKIFNCNPKDDNKVLANGSNIATGALAGDITLTAEGGEYNNIKIGATSTDYFVILYYPGTSLNSSSKYLVAASTVLPDAEKYPVTFGVVGNAGGTVSATSGGQAIESGDEVTVATFTAHPESGYGVEGWYSDAAGTSKIAAAGNATTYTQTITESNATVYVKFAKVHAIYFKPNDQNHWGSKWVYIFSESPWNGDKIQPGGKMLDHGQMTEENGLYSYQIKAALGNDNYCFAFNWNDQSGNSDFYNCEAVYRGDFHKDMPVYISEQGQGMTEKKNDVKYYNKGVWMRYNDVEPGYDLGLRNQADDNANMVFHRFKAGSTGGYVSTVSVTLEANKTYSFLVKNDKPYYYHVSSETTCTPDANHFALYQQEDAAYQHEVVIKPTITGIYTFQLNLANGKAEIDVLYPSTNYRLVYAEVAGGKCVKFHPSSPYIKVIDGEATQDIVSLHVRCSIPDFAKDDLGHTTQITGWTPNTNSRYVYLQKTEDGNTWTTVDTKDITAAVTKNGVYNFVVEQDEAGAHIGESIAEYTGNYYIRTNLADGGWNNYTAESNRFTYSDYAAKNRYFDHYWCKYHNGGNIDLSFVVANDYSLCVSDTCVDEMDSRDFTTNGLFDKQANIRFSYSSEANTTDRAYIAGAGNNLWLLTKDGKITCDNKQFSDRGNWVYYLDVTAQPEAMIGLQKKPYNGAKDDYFVIGSNADNCSHKLLTGTGRNNYHVRILYDFKSDHLIYGWMPDENETIEGELPLDASVIFVRVGHGQANQLSFKNKEGKDGAVIKVDEALGVLTINKNDYLNKPNPFKRDYYWISFPFDVEVSDIFSAFVLNKHFWIQEYDGASRALHGCFADSPTYWKSLGKGDRLHKGQGYVVYLEHDAILKDNLYAHTDALSLYFPSNGLTEINGTPMEVTVPEHKCTITKPYDRTVYDSNWNLIGVAAWADISALSDIHRDNPEYTDVLHISGDQKVGFYYHLNTGEEGKTPNTWTPMQAEQADGTNFEETFQTMYSYLVQWYGTITWTATVTFNEPGKQALQARRAPGQETKEYTLRLECGRADAMPDQTFVRLQEEGEVTADYDVNYDMTKMLNAGCTNIYSLIGDRRIQAGANVMPLPAENTTVYVPLGVVADKDGTYRFSMPDGTEGMTVLLADYETGMTYNLALGDYEVPLTAGTYEQRFVLEIQPKKNIVTGCNESKADDAPLRKVLIDGNLYIQRGKELYNISGAHL